MKKTQTSVQIVVVAMMLMLVSCQTNWFINPPASTSVCAEYRIEYAGSGNCPSSSTYTVCISCKTCKASPYTGLTASPQPQRRIKTDNTWESTPTEREADNDHWMCFSTNVEEYDTPGPSGSLCLTMTKSWKSTLCSGAQCPHYKCKSCYKGTTPDATGKRQDEITALNTNQKDSDVYLCPQASTTYETPGKTGSLCLSYQKVFTCTPTATCFRIKCATCITGLTPNPNDKQNPSGLTPKEGDNDAWMCYPDSNVPDKFDHPAYANSVCTTYSRDYNTPSSCTTNDGYTVCKTCKNGSTPTAFKSKTTISGLTMIEKMNDRWMCSYTESPLNTNSVCSTYFLDYVTASCSADSSKYCISCSTCKSGSTNAAKKGSELLALTTAQRDNDAWMCTSIPNTNTNTGFTVILDSARSFTSLCALLHLLVLGVIMSL